MQRIMDRTRLFLLHFCKSKEKVVNSAYSNMPSFLNELPVTEKVNVSSDFSELQFEAERKDAVKNSKRLRVGVIGMPNVGKSTLVNTLINTQVMATSTRIDTTVKNSLGIFTHGDVQIEFQDSPGIFNKSKSKRFHGQFNQDFPSDCFAESDICLVVVDLSMKRTLNGFLDPEVLVHLIKHQHIPSILVINKLDKVKKKSTVYELIPQLTTGVVGGVECKPVKRKNPPKPIEVPPVKAEVIQAINKVDELSSTEDLGFLYRSEEKLLQQLRNCRGWPHFNEVFVISALRGWETDRLRNYLTSKTKSGRWNFPQNVVTPEPTDDILKGIVRSAMLDNLPYEIPYQIKVAVSSLQRNHGVMNLQFELVCRKNAHARLLNQSMDTIEYSAKSRIEKLLNCEATVQLMPYLK